jgi:hypothetical protein
VIVIGDARRSPRPVPILLAGPRVLVVLMRRDLVRDPPGVGSRCRSPPPVRVRMRPPVAVRRVVVGFVERWG